MSEAATATRTLLEVENLSIEYRTRQGFLQAVDDVSFSLEEGEALGLVGESGCGKTTTGRCLLRAIEPTSGEVRVLGETWNGGDDLRLRQRIGESELLLVAGSTALGLIAGEPDVVEQKTPELDLCRRHGVVLRHPRGQDSLREIPDPLPRRECGVAVAASGPEDQWYQDKEVRQVFHLEDGDRSSLIHRKEGLGSLGLVSERQP